MPEEGDLPTQPAAETEQATPQTAPAPQEPPAAPPDEARLELESLRRRRDELETREKELVERLARMQADFENYRRRSREDAAAATGRGKESLLKALLPVLDNLDRALAYAEDEGLRLLARQLHQTLAAQGVAVLDPMGEAFDAKQHEAIAQQAAEGVKAGTIVAVAEKGYALEGRVLRPARVVVAA